ncbi:biliverdin-producing heme oxygenase [Nostoc sp. 'Lobaria pulmonaria (5183) cyanobiont']|uniref:biliverdin-producing heme oxygenase n=1 Tax=Nostoc sp. 'Lobaria pulmonaria (5183) cyanobiont' TaxID=1618022 RepID=UPI000CF355AE|nr:biliverdin-producing heme oxygenase [Nostoc sp. 'Lobaria pulmonaria (5183) cyanobiont']
MRIKLSFSYPELEVAFKSHLDHPVISAVYFLELNRQSSLGKDMVFYYEDNWREQVISSLGN